MNLCEILPLYPSLVKIIRSYGRFFTLDETRHKKHHFIFMEEFEFLSNDLIHPQAALWLFEDRNCLDGNVFLLPDMAKNLKRFNKNMKLLNDNYPNTRQFVSRAIKYVYYYSYIRAGEEKRWPDEHFSMIIELNIRKANRFLLLIHKGNYGNGYTTHFNKYYLYKSVDEVLKNHENLKDLFYEFQNKL